MLETKEFELNMGPQHPSTHGVLRLVLYLDGETIKDVETVMGYLHRGTEKLCETRNYYQNVPFTDRTDYLAAPYNNLGYVETVERLGGYDVSERALYARMTVQAFKPRIDNRYDKTRIVSHGEIAIDAVAVATSESLLSRVEPATQLVAISLFSLWLRWGAGATWRDIGLSRDKLGSDIVIGI